MKKLLVLAVSGSALAAWTSGPAAGQARLWEEPGPCDRSCLIEIVDSYLAAMVAHDTQAAPLGSDIRFTENTELKTVGDGLHDAVHCRRMVGAISCGSGRSDEIRHV
jgi:hypothetical protein